ncbi:hypothetical protein HMPREF9372_1026 [Sporosarcina newyorkensis 2681]|uniref:Uncharacterized protein n=1 Tax=Sporosarcina newyorkensis 2681 TaxID=1027292 RepID=F9DQE6_9BACL|nr:hypothetical protein HMPREF9372_1026 [Sporosarcina newyorkensis 2681]
MHARFKIQTQSHQGVIDYKKSPEIQRIWILKAFLLFKNVRLANRMG